jgi:hypothetical protein
MRFFLLLHTRKYTPGLKMQSELQKYRTCGWIFLLMNLSLALIVFFMIYWNRTFEHHMITAIAMAAYTFTALTVAIVNVIKYRKYNIPVFSASKAISLTAALVSVLTLESTMLTTFGDGTMTVTGRKIMLSATGGVISVFIVTTAIYMIVDGTKKIRKIKTEVELRKDAIVNTKKCIWSNLVDRVHFPYRPYLEVFEDEHVLNIRRIMNFLSEESVYPVYMHCHGGADRTGMIAFFLRALLGEEDEIIHIDYELTSLSTYAFGIEEGAEETGFRSRYYPYYRNFIVKLQEYAPNKPLSVCVYNFLLSCGVEEECIDKIRNILRKQ